MAETAPTKPVQTIRHGALSASIWRNDSANGPWYSVTFTRSFYRGNKWEYADSYGLSHLPALAVLATETYLAMLRLQEQDRELAAQARGDSRGRSNGAPQGAGPAQGEGHGDYPN